MSDAPFLHELPTFYLDDIERHAQANPAIDTATTRAVLLTVDLVDDDVIPKETCGLGTGLRDERLFLGEFQFQGISQEFCQLTLYLLGFRFRASKSEQDV